MRRVLLLLLALAPMGVRAQIVDPRAAMILLGEWHFGYTTVPSELQDTATDGRQRSLGIAFPIQVSRSWQVRPRYDDGLFSGSQSFGSGATTATVVVKQRHGGLDLLYALDPQGDRGALRRPYLYLGVGVGLMQTWHERTLNGYLGLPGLPTEASEETWSPAGRVLLGVQLHAGVALEAQVQTSTHHFEGARYADTCATLGLRIWPAVWFHRVSPIQRGRRD